MQNHPVILFDGVCNLCSGAVAFLIKRDTKDVFKFASLQSVAAQQLLQQHGDFKKFDSIILLENGKLFQKSTAALKVVNHLSWYWQWMQIFWILPRAVRDAAYDLIARNRYKWFGKKDECMIPSPELKSRFLSEPV